MRQQYATDAGVPGIFPTSLSQAESLCRPPENTSSHAVRPACAAERWLETTFSGEAARISGFAAYEGRPDLCEALPGRAGGEPEQTRVTQRMG